MAWVSVFRAWNQCRCSRSAKSGYSCCGHCAAAVVPLSNAFNADPLNSLARAVVAALAPVRSVRLCTRLRSCLEVELWNSSKAPNF